MISLKTFQNGRHRAFHLVDFIRTSVYDENSGSMKITTHLDHITHCRAAYGADWSNRWTYQVSIINTRHDQIPVLAPGGFRNRYPLGPLVHIPNYQETRPSVKKNQTMLQLNCPGTHQALDLEKSLEGVSHKKTVIDSEGCRESRRCSRDTYLESCIAKYTNIRRLTASPLPNVKTLAEWVFGVKPFRSRRSFISSCLRTP